MELRIGVIHTGKELSVEIDGSADDVIKQVEAALKNGDAFVWLTDSKGRRVGVTADKIAYIEIDEDSHNRRVGFGR
jgi:DNA-binding MurR/RpiR family transcriptional regulator